MYRDLHYAGAGLNRVAELRDDTRWLARALDAPDSRYWLMIGDRHLVGRTSDAPLCLSARQFGPLQSDVENLVALGIAEDGAAEFAAGLAASGLDRLERARPNDDGVRSADLRRIGPQLDRSTAARLAYARGLLIWHARTRYCPACGAPTRSEAAGHRRRCTADDCATPQFPRTDPAVIMLIANGEHCLLGRQAVWPPGMHSVLAGFVEPGESLEEAVAREVWEEAGISVVDIRYRASQPWPFPGSIMLGFTGRALTSKLNRLDGELESLRWYHRRELLASPEDDRFRLPRRDSIARRLIEAWLHAAD